MKYYHSKNFCTQEYVTPELYNQLGDNAILVMDERILKTDDALRDFFGKPIIINNWHCGKDRKLSGWRPFGSGTGAKYSQHCFGRASDKLIVGINVEEARKAILENIELFPFITVIEDKVSWLHTDCRCITDRVQLIRG